MQARANVTLTLASAWLALIAVTLVGVDAVLEEAAPVEQYNDSGDTIRQAGVLYPTSIALESLLTKSVEDGEEGSEDKRSAPEWNNLHGGWGKRQKNWESTDPERARNLNRLLGLLRKRAPKWNDLNGGWGKRSGAQWNSLNGAWGKRGWNDMNHGYGKRQSPHWNNLRGMWGKK